MSKHFDGDLAAGKLAEDAFARILLDGREKWEHKRDFKCVETGNVALEFATSSLPHGAGEVRPSGIAVCHAYWFVVEYAPECRHVMPLEAVKALARSAFRDGRHKWVGDDSRFHNALVPLSWFWTMPDQQIHEVAA